MNNGRNRRTGLTARLAMAGATLILGVAAMAPAVTAGNANLTRFGPERFEREPGKPQNYSATFNAISGPAELVLQDDGIVNARIKVNGVDLVTAADFRGDGEFIIPLDLYPENTIDVSVLGKPGGTLGVRVTQYTESSINVRAKMYFGINTSYMDRW